VDECQDAIGNSQTMLLAPPLHRLQARKGFDRLGEICTNECRGTKCCDGVLGNMTPRHTDLNLDRFTIEGCPDYRALAISFEIGEAEIGLGMLTECIDPLDAGIMGLFLKE